MERFHPLSKVPQVQVLCIRSSAFLGIEVEVPKEIYFDNGLPRFLALDGAIKHVGGYDIDPLVWKIGSLQVGLDALLRSFDKLLSRRFVMLPMSTIAVCVFVIGIMPHFDVCDIADMLVCLRPHDVGRDLKLSAAVKDRDVRLCEAVAHQDDDAVEDVQALGAEVLPARNRKRACPRYVIPSDGSRVCRWVSLHLHCRLCDTGGSRFGAVVVQPTESID